MRTLTRIRAAIDRLNERIGQGVSWLVLLMVIVGAFNAIARYAGPSLGLNLASNAWLELQWYLFSLVFLLGAADVLRRDAHVRVDVMYGRLTPRRKAWVNLVGTLVFLIPFCIFGLVVSFPSVQASWHVWEQSPDPGGLPRWPIKTSILIGFGLLLLQGIAQAIKHIEGLRTVDAEEGT